MRTPSRWIEQKEYSTDQKLSCQTRKTHWRLDLNNNSRITGNYLVEGIVQHISHGEKSGYCICCYGYLAEADIVEPLRDIMQLTIARYSSWMDWGRGTRSTKVRQLMRSSQKVTKWRTSVLWLKKVKISKTKWTHARSWRAVMTRRRQVQHGLIKRRWVMEKSSSINSNWADKIFTVP